MGLLDRIRRAVSRLFRREYVEPIEITEPEPTVVEERPIVTEIPREPEIIIPEERPEIIEKPPEERELSKIVVFSERIRNTRIRRKVARAYPLDTDDMTIHQELQKQYDIGGNYVIQVENISIGEMKQFEEKELEVGLPGSADLSP